MIHIGKYLHIHILTPVLFCICYFFSRTDILAVSYATMILHELSHTMAAVFIGLKIDRFVLYPFGVNLKLKNKFVHSLCDEIILYLSGPLFNALFALVMLGIYGFNRDYRCQYLFFMNIALFISNMLPILPLDGGVIMKKILSYYFGTKTAINIMRVISGVLFVFIAIFCIWSVVMCRFNFSVILIAVFLGGSMLFGQEKYDADFIRSLMFSKDKENKNVRHIIAKESDSMRDIAKRFVNNKYSVIYLTDNEGKISDTITEREVIDRLV